jgi:hypothetical protein
MARITPVEEQPEPEIAELPASMMPAGVPPIRLFRTLARNEPTLQAMHALGGFQLNRAVEPQPPRTRNRDPAHLRPLRSRIRVGASTSPSSQPKPAWKPARSSSSPVELQSNRAGPSANDARSDSSTSSHGPTISTTTHGTS